jgi:hypothetical protein
MPLFPGKNIDVLICHFRPTGQQLEIESKRVGEIVISFVC